MPGFGITAESRQKASFVSISILGIVFLLPFSVLAEEESAAVFAKRTEYFDAVISPGGDYIAVERSADEGKKLVAIVSTEDLRLLGHIPAGSDYSPFNPQWASDERLIVQMTEDREGSEFEFANGELVAIDFDGNKRRQLIEHQLAVYWDRDKPPLNALHGFAQVVHRLPDDRNHVLIRLQEPSRGDLGRPPSLYRIHVVRGRVTRIADAPTFRATFVFTPDGELVYSVGLDGDSLKAGVNRWVTHRFNEGEWERLDELDIDGNAFTVIAASGGSDIYVQVGYRDKPDRIYRYDLVTGDRKLVFAHPDVDPARFDFDRKTGELIAVHFDDPYPNLHLVDEEHLYSRWYPALFRAFGGNRVRITSASDDGRLILVHVSGDREPGQFRLLDTETRDMKYLFNAASWIDSAQLAEMRAISFESRDGKQIHGYLTQPAETDGAVPLVVMPHGGPYGVKDSWNYHPRAQFLASHGYAVLQVNFRGSGGFGWGFTESGYGRWGTDIQYDVIDGTRWAASLDEIDSSRICIVGGSFGGYSALMAPTIAPDLFKCAVGFAGVYDLALMWTTADIEKTRGGKNYLAKAIGDDPDVLRRDSPLHNIDKLTIPVFLAHGEKDWRVDVKHFKKMTRALDEAGHPYEALLLTGEGHGLFDEDNRAIYLERLAAFLSKHIGPD